MSVHRWILACSLLLCTSAVTLGQPTAPAATDTPSATASPSPAGDATPTVDATPSGQDSPWRGRYRLRLSGDDAWHQDAAEITSANAEEIQGTFEIDLKLGPDSRPPTLDEALFKVPFKARRTVATDPYLAEMLVGAVQPKVYRFEIYPIEDGKTLAGVVTMGSRKTGFLLSRD